ncbi:MAG TPA: aminotransferase class IV [Clostridiales bacterium]|nr:aminotransferase class IV [Clostridiales bacterium]
MEDNAGKYVVHNGIVKESTEISSVDSREISGRAAYEVIRIIDGVPLFFEDHYDRLKATFKAIGKHLDLTDSMLAEDIRKLLDKSGSANCNVKLVIPDEAQERVVYISKSYYPTEAEFSNGVRTGLLQIERENPNAKIYNKAYKDAVGKKLAEGGYFEVILVDSEGRITEGSKSNLFFIKNGRIVTTPGEFVLKGITRKYVFEACRNAGFDVEEEFVRASDIGIIDGCFLSGTSIKVLPVRSIDDVVLNSANNPVITAIRREYDRIIGEYIDSRVNLW